MKKIKKFALLGIVFFCACTEKPTKISGRIDLLPSFQKSLSSNAVLYVIARSETLSGPPVAVKRFTQPLVFPLDFSLSSEDAMISNTPFQGKMVITARIAQTGSATPIKKGDIGSSTNLSPVTVGEKSVKISLDRLL